MKLCYITDFTARLPLGYGFHFGEFAGGMALLAVGVWGLSVLRKWLGPDGVEIAWWIVAAFFVLLAILF